MTPADAALAAKLEHTPEELANLLKMLHGRWSSSEDGFWPSIDAMEEAAGVIEALLRMLDAREFALRMYLARDDAEASAISPNLIVQCNCEECQSARYALRDTP